MARPIKSRSSRKKNFISVLLFNLLRGFGQFIFSSLPYLLSLALVAVVFGVIIGYAVNSPTFQLQEVRILNAGTMTADQAFRFCELKRGENLITIDLVGVQQVIKRKHPEYKEVFVRRILPNRIEVMLKRRTPVAQVAFSRYVQVDKDLVLLPGSATVPFKNLTVIEGSPIPREGLYVGIMIKDKVTQNALRLMEAIKRSNILRGHTLTHIDIGDPKNILLKVDSDIEIRVGGNHFIDRLKILDQTLKSVELDKTKIRYIDLRFDDVVIGPR